MSRPLVDKFLNMFENELFIAQKNNKMYHFTIRNGNIYSQLVQQWLLSKPRYSRIPLITLISFIGPCRVVQCSFLCSLQLIGQFY